MKVAEIVITLGRFHEANKHGVGFTDAVEAKNEYLRVAEQLKKRGERKNAVEAHIKLTGINELAFQLDDLVSVALIDFVSMNEQLKGVAGAFPLLYPR